MLTGEQLHDENPVNSMNVWLNVSSTTGFLSFLSSSRSVPATQQIC